MVTARIHLSPYTPDQVEGVCGERAVAFLMLLIRLLSPFTLLHLLARLTIT